MGILCFCGDLSPPSVLWMRRMLAGIGDQVSILATEVDPGAEYSARYNLVVLRDSPWSAARRLWLRLQRRLRLINHVPKAARAITTLREAVSSSRVSAVLVHYLTSAVDYERVWTQTPKPVFVHCHGWDVTWDLRSPEDREERVHPVDYVERVLALGQNVQFIANSMNTRQRLIDIGISPERIHVKYLGVPTPSTLPAREHRSAELNILYLGNLVDCKGPDLVMRAFDTACARGLRGQLIIAGDGHLRGVCHELRSDLTSRGRITLLGAVDADTGAKLRSEADVFTAHNQLGPVTGQEEAFGVSIVEAMAAGLPIVTGVSGAISELLEDDVQGILIQPGDIQAHAEAFLRLAREPATRSRMGHNGWARAQARFSLEHEISQLRRILGCGERGDDRN